MPVPLLDLTAQYAEYRDEVLAALQPVFASQKFVLGEEVARFEREVGEVLGARHAIGVASGSDALLLALMALDVGPGDGVIVTPFTFFSTVSSITRLGATPLFVDIEPRSYLLSAAGATAFLSERGRIQEGHAVDAITSLRIKALLPVHLFGQCCAMTDFLALAKKYNVHVVEDVAQACGARIAIAGQTKSAGAVGTIGCFSFFPSKTLGGFGDGGLVATGDQKLAAKVRMLRVHGEGAKYHHQATGINSRLDSLQAAVLSVKQRYLDQWCEQRIQRAQTYHRLFTDSGLVSSEVLSIPATTTDKSHVFNNYVIRARRRDDLTRFLAEQGIQTEVYYPVPLHLQPCFAPAGYKQGDFPNAERAAAEVLALPIYPELTLEQQETVVGNIKDFYRT